MYSAAKLDQIAQDPDFVDLVRQVGADLIQATPDQPRELLPLRNYGPRTSGVLLRLEMLQYLPVDWSQLSPEAWERIFQAQDRLHEADESS